MGIVGTQPYRFSFMLVLLAQFGSLAGYITAVMVFDYPYPSFVLQERLAALVLTVVLFELARRRSDKVGDSLDRVVATLNAANKNVKGNVQAKLDAAAKEVEEAMARHEKLLKEYDNLKEKVLLLVSYSDQWIIDKAKLEKEKEDLQTVLKKYMREEGK